MDNLVRKVHEGENKERRVRRCGVFGRKAGLQQTSSKPRRMTLRKSARINGHGDEQQQARLRNNSCCHSNG